MPRHQAWRVADDPVRGLGPGWLASTAAAAAWLTKLSRTPSTTSTTWGTNPFQTTPWMQQWNISVQQEIMPNTVMVVAYVGSNGRSMVGQRDVNPPLPGVDASRKLSGETICAFPAVRTTWLKVTSLFCSRCGSTSTWSWRPRRPPAMPLIDSP